MRALYYNGTKAEFRTDLPVPAPQAHESLVRVSLGAICNTDREIMKGYRPDFRGVIGHEFVGVVEQSSDPALVGKKVVGELNEGCGDCLYCNTGREGHCKSRKCIGIAGKDGCFAGYLTLATKLLHPVPDTLSDEAAVFAEPLAAALQIPQLVPIRPADEVCVVGDGRLSFMISQVLALTGAEVTVVGRSEEKLSLFAPFAKTTMDCDRTFETVVEASGSPSGLESALKLVRSRGTIVVKSTYAGKTELDFSQVVVNELRLVGSRCGPFEPAVRLLSRGLIILPDIELHDISDWKTAFESRAFKVGFDFRGETALLK